MIMQTKGTDLREPNVYCSKVVIMICRPLFHIGDLGFESDLFSLVLTHLTEDCIFLEGLSSMDVVS